MLPAVLAAARGGLFFKNALPEQPAQRDPSSCATAPHQTPPFAAICPGPIADLSLFCRACRQGGNSRRPFLSCHVQLANRPHRYSTTHREPRLRIVSADPATHPDALADVRDALKAVRALRGGDAEFFSGVFSRLESATGAVKASQQARDRQLHELRQQQQLWEQERTVLEHELEAVRNRVAELSETVARQKRDAESQQQQWSGELKRMRRSLQEVVLRLAERAQETADPAVRNVTRSPDTSKVGAIADPVLDSVMAQFEILQNDVARRRKPPAS